MFRGPADRGFRRAAPEDFRWEFIQPFARETASAASRNPFYDERKAMGGVRLVVVRALSWQG